MGSGGIPKSGWRDRSWKPGGRASGAGVRIPFPPPFKIFIAGWSSSVARWAHNPEVVGSNPSPATMVPWCSGYHVCLSRKRSRVQLPSEPPFFYGFIAQSVEQRTENPRVAGSIPAGATIIKIKRLAKKSFLCYYVYKWRKLHTIKKRNI